MLRSLLCCAGINPGLQGAIGDAISTRCCECATMGATVKCSHPSCKSAFHLHCAAKCKLDWGAASALLLLCVCVYVWCLGGYLHCNEWEWGEMCGICRVSCLKGVAKTVGGRDGQ